MIAGGLIFQQFHDQLEGSIEKRVPGVCVGDDRTVTGSGKQNDAERGNPAGTLFDEVTIGCNADFMLWPPLRIPATSADYRYDDSTLFQRPPGTAKKVSLRVLNRFRRLVAVESGFP